MKANLLAGLAGLVFAAGLALSGMTNPGKVVGFLDVTGAWDASLAFVMLGAIGVHFVARRFILRLEKPVYGPRFDVPTKTSLDVGLVAGAAIFGAGWGIAGYCPGPALVSAGAGSLSALVFVCTMAVGMAAYRAVRFLASVRPAVSTSTLTEIANRH